MEKPITITPLSKPRKGWDEAFIQMNANKDDQLLIDDVFEEEIPEEWK